MSQLMNRLANYQRFSAGRQRQSLVGIVQCRSTMDHQENFDKIAYSIQQCVDRGAELVCLPENFAYNVGDRQNVATMWHENPETGFWFQQYRQLALDNQVWLSLGSFPETSSSNDRVCYSTHFIICNEGNVAQKYRKMHILESQVDESGSMAAKSNDSIALGHKIANPCFTPIGYTGLSVSYDLRFPELYRQLTMRGAQALLVPSAFLAKTGANHWETLLRTRAIENQSYVIAAAQVGSNQRTGNNHGHSMVVDPWGDIIAQSSDKEGFFCCELDLNYLNEVRTQMNSLSHIRHNILI